MNWVIGARVVAQLEAGQRVGRGRPGGSRRCRSRSLAGLAWGGVCGGMVVREVLWLWHSRGGRDILE